MKSVPLALQFGRESAKFRDVTLVVGGAAVLFLAAQYQIPFLPVPFTLQTLAVLLIGLTMGMKRGFAASALYLAAGIGGLPVFAGWAGGFAHLIGPTGGYLAAMPLAAAFVGWTAERGWDRSPWLCFAACAAADAFVLAAGTLVLSYFIGARGAIMTGCAVFLPSELLKIAVAAACPSLIRKGLRQAG